MPGEPARGFAARPRPRPGAGRAGRGCALVRITGTIPDMLPS